MAFQLVSMHRPLWVDGHTESVGDFSGLVLCVAMRDTDPIAHTATETNEPEGVEGLDGWGSTFFLVADGEKSAPVWVAKNDVTRHVVGDEALSQPR